VTLSKWVVGVGLAAASLAAQAGILRCGNQVVQEGEPASAVVARCGKPVLVEDISRRQESQSGELTQVKEGERWTLSMGKGQFMQIVTIKDGKITQISNGPRE